MVALSQPMARITPGLSLRRGSLRADCMTPVGTLTVSQCPRRTAGHGGRPGPEGKEGCQACTSEPDPLLPLSPSLPERHSQPFCCG